MDKKLVFLDSVLLQQDMRIRLPKSVLVNIDGKAGETRLDVYFDAITKEIILRNSDNQNNKESKTKNKVKGE
ncbi:sucrose-6-phosphate hydrolase [Clostridiaceae bacterium AM27-36LB]|nr:sucrose-6-phosphate hydrolase [Clostridiales bacterium AM23-16LB]RHR44162.1 sucrose-6-phosphate hydrolase [Clostridiaceae bacterium AF18-31LB]RHT82087.1 sucrose-6-phosphate hydrolase [Clostridiaceae bacterium AM27-36LB]RHW03941.1 sucrose-6-phosphate hydrolase [Clostridiaceae bacterium OF09-1]